MVPGRTIHTPQDVYELLRDVAGSAPSPLPPIVVSREPWPPHLSSTDSSLPDSKHPRVKLPPQHQPAAREEARLMPQTAMSCKQAREKNVHASPPGSHQVAAVPRVRRKRVRAEDFWDRDEDERERLAKKPMSAAPATIVTSQPKPVDEQVCTKPVRDFPATVVTSQAKPVDEQAYTKPDEASLSSRPEGQGRIGWVLPEFAQGLHRPSGTGHRFGQPSVVQPVELNPPPHPPPDTTYLSLRKYPTGLKRSRDSLDHGPDPQNKARKRKRPTRGVSGMDRHLLLPQTPSNVGSSDTAALAANVTYTEQQPRVADRPTTFPKFMRLPEDVQDIIFGMLLQSDKPIRLNSFWFKPNMPPGLKVPSPTTTINEKTSLESPGLLRSELQRMRFALENQRMRVALENASQNQQSRKHQQVKGLTFSLLLVSKAVHERAAQSFYGENFFEFLSLSESWLHLDTFLTRIGSKNAKRIQHLRLKVPKWYPNASADAIAGALIDAASSGRRSVSLINQAEDRLLSAISTCTRMIATVGNLKSLFIHMQHKEMAAFLNIRQENWGIALSADENDSHEKRKEAGVRLLRTLSDALNPGCKPLLVVSGTTGSLHSTLPEKKGLQSNINCLPLVVTEAESFGWDVSSVIVDKRSRGLRKGMCRP